MIDQISMNDIYATKNSSTQTGGDPFSSIGADDFFELLIAKMQNQDPLNPIDDNEFISQVTQFTQLEELKSMKHTIENLAITQGAAASTQAVNLLNKYVVTEGNEFTIRGEGEDSKIRFELDKDATDVSLIVYDSSGNVVDVRSLGSMTAGSHDYIYDGKDLQGNQLDKGTYRYQIKAYRGSDEVDVKTYSIRLVDGIKFENGDVILKSGDSQIDLSDIIEILI